MFKARNIMIIFALNYLLILLVCCLLEIIFISNHAQDAQLLMRTAADMALEQVQATDDFFVTGGGYLLNNEDGYKVTVNTGSKFEQVNLFPAFTGVANTKSNVGQMYQKLYGYGRMNEFVSNSLSGNPDSPVKGNVLSLSFVGGAIQEPKTETVTVGGNEYLINSSILYTNWYYIPKLYQMGLNGILDMADYEAEGYIKVLNELMPNKANDVTAMINMYELWDSEKLAYMSGSSEPISYYLTPISLGVTYINEELLQALFMNNLDLLMRCKYMQNADYDLTSAKYGSGMLKGEFYPELVDTDSLSEYNPINNGLFTLLRGREVSGTGENAKFYQGTVKPKIEYVVIDMYNNNATNNEMLRNILGPRFTTNTANSSYFNNPSYASTYRGQKITGSLLKEIDQESIDNLVTITGTGGNEISKGILSHKPIVVAKVTFYADFVIPFSTVSLREMRGREVDGNIGGRLLFDAFSQSTTDGYSALDTNYVELRNKTKAADGSAGNMEWDKIYTDEYYDDVSTVGGVYSRLNGNYHSDALCYTTYFAITP